MDLRLMPGVVAPPGENGLNELNSDKDLHACGEIVIGS